MMALLAAGAAATELEPKRDARGQWWYVLEGGKAKIMRKEEAPIGDLLIPDELDGYIVSSIGEGAFNLCSGLTSVTIPDSVTQIGDRAFNLCSGLTSVTIPDSVTSIGSNAFNSCSGLTTISIPASITSIGFNPFANCPLLYITVSSNNMMYTDIDGILFDKQQTMIVSYPCAREGAYTIPDGVVLIGGGAFAACGGLTNVTFPDGVTSIGSSAFNSCSGLTNITIPASTINIGYNPFVNCPLSYINVSSSNPTYTHIDGVLFDKHQKMIVSYPCAKQGIYVIPDGVVLIGAGAFSACNSLTSIMIPNSVTSIGDEAFAWCSGLTSVTIPDSVTSIGNNAFSSCSGLTSIAIPNSITSIGDFAFAGCSGLTSVTIPDSVTSIGKELFFGCGEVILMVSEGSYAEQYAKDNGIVCVFINNDTSWLGS